MDAFQQINAELMAFMAQQGVVSVATLRGRTCLLYTSDAADERSSVDLGGRRIIKKKKIQTRDGETLRRTTRQATHCALRSSRQR